MVVQCQMDVSRYPYDRNVVHADLSTLTTSKMFAWRLLDAPPEKPSTGKETSILTQLPSDVAPGVEFSSHPGPPIAILSSRLPEVHVEVRSVPLYVI